MSMSSDRCQNSTGEERGRAEVARQRTARAREGGTARCRVRVCPLGVMQQVMVAYFLIVPDSARAGPIANK